MSRLGYVPPMSEDPRSNDSSERVPFGGQHVPADAKRRLVSDVFDSVANRYDLMNDIMSGGIHRIWKRRLLDELAVRPPTRLLDLAGGTGDIALRALQRFAQRETEITICDINLKMLNIGRQRVWDRGHLHRINWLCADGEALPIPDHSFDACTLAFGLRNMTHIERGLAEIFRILQPGGRFLCLEFTPDVAPPLRGLYETYSGHVIPRIGDLITGDAEAYKYLVESIRQFPRAKNVAHLLEKTGFAGVRINMLSLGVATLLSAWRV